MKKWAAFSLGILVILNFLDASFTIYSIEKWGIEELNPIAAILIEHGYVWFMLWKVGIVSLGVWILWSFIRHSWAQIGALIGASVYSGVIFWHIWGMCSLLRG